MNNYSTPMQTSQYLDLEKVASSLRTLYPGIHKSYYLHGETMNGETSLTAAITLTEKLVEITKPEGGLPLETFLLSVSDNPLFFTRGEFDREFAERLYNEATGNIEEKPARGPEITSVDIIEMLERRGYVFRLNLCGDVIEVSGEEISDVLEAKIRTEMRDAGLKNMARVEDAYTANAFDNRYHPIKEYLESLKWDGEDHIGKLSDYITDTDGMFPVWLLKWLIGSVNRVYTGKHHPVLSMEGAQGRGKSFFAKWICPLSDYHKEGSAQPDNKDHILAMGRKWVWELGELGNVTRRADREALKNFLSQESVEERKAFGRRSPKRRAIVSFIGTVNDEGTGFLTDPTGNRRYLSCSLVSIDWNYANDIDVNQVWAQAYAIWSNDNDAWRLSKEEERIRDGINERHTVEDPTIDYIRGRFMFEAGHDGDDSWFVAGTEIIDQLSDKRIASTARGVQMAISSAIAKYEGDKVVKGRRGSGDRARGYFGMRPLFETHKLNVD